MLTFSSRFKNSQSAITGPQVGFAIAVYAVAAGTMVASFLLLRPTNRIVYEPKLKYADGSNVCPSMSRNPLACIPPLWRMKEKQLLPILGLDAIAYLRFTRMMRWCVTIVGIFLCAVLIPIDVISNVHDRSSSSASDDQSNWLVMITMRDVHGSNLWAHVAMSYFATLVSLAFLWYNWRHMLKLRWAWYRSPEYQNALYARTLLITHVPPKLRSDEALSDVLQRLKMPYPTTEVFIGRDMGLLPDLIDRHKDLVRKLERALVWYIRSPTAVRSRRPTTRVGGWLGLGGSKVDAIDYYSDQIEQVETSIHDWRQRISEKRPVSYGFASTAAVHFAHAAARSLRRKRPHGLKIQLSPPPNAIIWRNLTLGSWQRFRSSFVGFLLLLILLFVNAVPLTGVNLISNMSLFASRGVSYNEGTGSDVSSETVQKPLVPFLYQWRASHKLSFAAVAGILPPLISAVAGWLLPICMRRLAKYRGIASKVTTDHVILSQYYGYLVISQLVVFTLIGVLINLLIIVGTSAHKSVKASKILDRIQLPHLPQNIKQQYFMLGNYWLTWMPLKAMLSFLDLSQLIKLFFVWFQKGLFSKTPRDVRELTEPPFFEYSNYYANDLFVGAVVMVYAPLSPLIVLLGAVVFWAYSISNKYQLMYVKQTKHETGGVLWQAASNRFMVNLLLMQGILILSVLLEDIDTGYRAVACLPPILFVLAFKLYLRSAFERHFQWYIPSEEEATLMKVHRGDQDHKRLERRFGHPVLTARLWTPMVHAWSQPLLPQVYSGRIEEGKASVVDGRAVETAAVDGGLKIALMEEDQLEYDPRKDEDTRSILSATTLSAAVAPSRLPPKPSPLGMGYEAKSYFEEQRPVYHPSSAGAQEEYEMGSLYAASDDKRHFRASKDTLLPPDLDLENADLLGEASTASSLYKQGPYHDYNAAIKSQMSLHAQSRPVSPAPSAHFTPTFHPSPALGPASTPLLTSAADPADSADVAPIAGHEYSSMAQYYGPYHTTPSRTP